MIRVVQGRFEQRHGFGYPARRPHSIVRSLALFFLLFFLKAVVVVRRSEMSTTGKHEFQIPARWSVRRSDEAGITCRRRVACPFLASPPTHWPVASGNHDVHSACFGVVGRQSLDRLSPGRCIVSFGVVDFDAVNFCPRLVAVCRFDCGEFVPLGFGDRGWHRLRRQELCALRPRRAAWQDRVS